MSPDWTEIPLAGVKAICKIATLNEHVESSRLIDQLGANPDSVPCSYAYPTQLDISNLEQLSHHDLRTAQERDPVIGKVKRAVETSQLHLLDKSQDPNVALFQRQSTKLIVKNKIHFRTVKKESEADKLQLVLPEKYRQMVLHTLHDDSGHLGVDRMTELLANRFYWPRMTHDISGYIKNCGRCITRKSLPQRAAPLGQIRSTGPLDLVCIDFLSVEPDTQGIANVLVVTDHYTRYAQAFPV